MSLLRRPSAANLTFPCMASEGEANYPQVSVVFVLYFHAEAYIGPNHRRRSRGGGGVPGSGPTQSCNKGGPPMDGPIQLLDNKMTFISSDINSSKVSFSVRQTEKV
jgi:hypothetical protein